MIPPLTDNGDAFLGSLANYVCGELPEGWSLCLEMENGYGGTVLLDQSGTEVIPSDIDPADSTLAQQIVACVKTAQHHKPQPD